MAGHPLLGHAEYQLSHILLIVADASDRDVEKKIEVTEGIISELSASEKPRILVYNKCDEVEILPFGGDPESLSRRGAVCISAKNGSGIDSLLELIETTVTALSREVTFLFPFDNQSAVNVLYKKSSILNTEYTDEGTRVTALVDEEMLGRYKEFIVGE